jgi:Fe2+ transport system protein FeoA
MPKISAFLFFLPPDEKWLDVQRAEHEDGEPALTLRDLREGDRAEIRAIRGEGAFKRRLLEMGFMPGTAVLIKKYAPLRDPIEFVLKGYHVSLRREEAQQVLVRSHSMQTAGHETGNKP